MDLHFEDVAVAVIETVEQSCELLDDSLKSEDFEDTCDEVALQLQTSRPADKMQQGLRRSDRERRTISLKDGR